MNILITRPLIDAEDLMGKFFSMGYKIINIPTPTAGSAAELIVWTVNVLDPLTISSPGDIRIVEEPPVTLLVLVYWIATWT